jgi:hypothetical protein
MDDNWQKYISYYNQKVVRNPDGQIPDDKIILNDKQLAEMLFKVTNDENSPSSNMIPIFYLFDNIIVNKDLYCDYRQFDHIKTYFQLDKLFGIITDNVMNISVSAHRTILYKFSYQTRKYIYYSNSGLGSENQLINSDETLTSCKIFNVKDDLFFNQLQNYFEFIIKFLNNDLFDQNDYANQKVIFCSGKNYEKCKEFFDNFDPLKTDHVEELLNFKRTTDTNSDQQIIYALLNLFCNTYPKIIIECTFNHVISLKEDDTLTDHNKRKYLNKPLTHLLTKQRNYVDLQPPSINNPFAVYINQINSKLQEYNNIASVKYKFNNNFSLVYDEKYGLFNKLQNAGSCTFYSYYNLAINMLILTNYGLHNNYENTVKSILTFHSYMMYLLCINFDTECFTDKLIQFNSQGYNFIQPIYDIIIQDKIADELIKMYEKDTLLFNNSDNIFVDNYYSKIRNTDIQLYQIKKISNTITKISNFSNILTNFYKCINKYLYNIRNKINFDKIEFLMNIRESINFEDLEHLYFYDKYTINRTDLTVFDEEEEESDYVPSVIESDDSLSSGGNNNMKSINIIDKYYHTLCEIWIFYISVLNDFNNLNTSETATTISQDKFEIDTLLNFYVLKNHKEDNIFTIINTENDLYKPSYKIGIETNNCHVLPFIYLSFDELCIISTYINNNRDKMAEKLKYYEINYSSYITYLSIENTFKTPQKNKITFSLFQKLVKDNLPLLSINEHYMFLHKNRFCVEYHNEDTNIPLLKYLNYDNVNYSNYDNEYKGMYIYLYYIELTHKINNEYISDEIKNNYKFEKESIKKNLLKRNEVTFFELYILLDEKLLIISDTDMYGVMSMDDLLFEYINKETEIYIYHGENYETNFELKSIYDKFNTNEIRINHIKNYLGDSYKKMDLLKKFEIIKDDIVNYTIIEKRFIVQEEGEEAGDISYHNSLELILHSFGIDIGDTNNYTIVINDSYILQTNLNKSRRRKQDYNTKLYNISERKLFSIFVIIHSENKVLELKFNRGLLLLNDCYIYVAKKKYKLICNLNKKTHPFIMYFPKNAPYLCYNDNNNYNLLYILNKKTVNVIYRLTKPTVDIYKYSIAQIFHLIIAPSENFPTISSFNKELYLDLFKIYDNTQLQFININQHHFFNFGGNDVYNKYIEHIFESVCEIITCKLEPGEINSFDKIIEDYPKKKNSCDCEKIKTIKKILHSFLSENRLINFTIKEDKKKIFENYFIQCISYKSALYESIKDNDIFNNLSTHIYIMQFNLIIKYINQILNDNITSGEIQGILNSLQCIKYFNTNKFIYYNIEILFLLQNEYFFKESQLNKYESIRNDMQINNNILKLHQFMMGKGKTSVFTPLLSFFASIVLNKKATIITLQHLIKDTDKYIAFLKILTNNNNINILSDSEAKKRWLLSNYIQNNIYNNEINIIDEIDTQHNYLNSMLNLIPEFSFTLIDEEFIDYTLDYTINNGKIHPIQDQEYFVNKIKDLFEQCELMDVNKKMEFNRTYGFDFLYDNNNKKKYRLCIPFVRKDTPQIGSQFSNIFLSLILTIKAYKILSNNEFTLLDELYDFDNLLKNIDILKMITNIIDSNDDNWKTKSITMYANIKKTLNPLDLIKEYFREFYTFNKIDLNKIILKQYLLLVNDDNIKYSQSQHNVSFQDIIYNNYQQWQVGYTGTASLELNDYFNKENFLFKCIDEDPDEFIEIKLAFNNNNTISNPIVSLNETDNIDIQINTIIEHLKNNEQNARGIVDLAGIFLNTENKKVAKIIKSKLYNNNIVYFEDDHEAYNYTNEQKIKYTPSHQLNFYYYDNCHTVGSDLKQPNDGHIAIIINKHTRYTDFAQALFRFRKINRGTYMSIIYIKNTTEQEIQLINYDNIYRLLQTNETKFNHNQKLGIQFQLLKTIIRKHTKNYLETDLKNIILENIDDEKIVEYLNKNILGIESMDDFFVKYNIVNDYKKYISDLYSSIQSDLSLLRQLIFDNNETQTNNKVTQEVSAESKVSNSVEVEAEAEAEITRINQQIISKYILIDEYRLLEKSVIKHQKCDKCIKFNCTPLFFNEYMKINNKPIFISYNLLTDTRQDISYFCFVEFEDMVLIENEKICIDYYIYRLPVYNYNGELIVFIPNTKPIISIDLALIRLLGIPSYISLDIKHTLTQITLKDLSDNLTNNSIIILGYHYIVFNKLYSSDDSNNTYLKEYEYILPYQFSKELAKKINEVNFEKLVRETLVGLHVYSNEIYNNTINPYTNMIVKKNLSVSYTAYIYDFPPDNHDGGYNTIYIKNKRKSKRKIIKKRFSIQKYI